MPDRELIKANTENIFNNILLIVTNTVKFSANLIILEV
jgi:hypothetical protein